MALFQPYIDKARQEKKPLSTHFINKFNFVNINVTPIIFVLSLKKVALIMSSPLVNPLKLIQH